MIEAWFIFLVIVVVVSCVRSGYLWGYSHGAEDGKQEARDEIERNGIRRGMHDAGRTTLPREGTRAAVVRRIRIKRK